MSLGKGMDPRHCCPSPGAQPRQSLQLPPSPSERDFPECQGSFSHRGECRLSNVQEVGFGGFITT